MKSKTVILFALAMLPLLAFADDFTLTDGREYKNATISRVEPDGIVVMTDDGVEKIPFKLLPQEIKDAYPYKAPTPAPTPTPAEIPVDESAAKLAPKDPPPATTSGSAALPAPSAEVSSKTNDLQFSGQTAVLLKAGLALAVSLISLIVAGLIANRILGNFFYNRIEKEFDDASAKQFDTIYADFFAILKLWNNYMANHENSLPDHGEFELPHGVRWELLTRVHLAEGSLDALFLKISAARRLTGEQMELMGRFRQGYLALGQAISNNKALNWNDAEHPDYLVFRRLASGVALTIIGENLGARGTDERADAFRQITSGRWERAWNSDESKGAAKSSAV